MLLHDIKNNLAKKLIYNKKKRAFKIKGSFVIFYKMI